MIGVAFAFAFAAAAAGAVTASSLPPSGSLPVDDAASSGGGCHGGSAAKP